MPRFEVVYPTEIRGFLLERGMTFDGDPEDAENRCVRLLGPSPDEQEKREDRLQNMSLEQLRNMARDKGLKYKTAETRTRPQFIELIRGASANAKRITEPAKANRVIEQDDRISVEVERSGNRQTINVRKRE